MHPKTKRYNPLIRGDYPFEGGDYPFEGGAYPFEGGPSNFPPLHYNLRHWAGC